MIFYATLENDGKMLCYTTPPSAAVNNFLFCE
jgi:hypothetical protein